MKIFKNTELNDYESFIQKSDWFARASWFSLNARIKTFQKIFINVICEIFEDGMEFYMTKIEFEKIC